MPGQPPPEDEDDEYRSFAWEWGDLDEDAD